MVSLELWESHQQVQFWFLAVFKVYQAAISEILEKAGEKFWELEGEVLKIDTIQVLTVL